MPYKDPARKKAKDAENYRKNWAERRRKQAVYRAANRERINEQQRGYREANRDELTARQRARYAENPEAILKRNRAWYEANREQAMAQVKAWIERNREKHLSYVQKWQRENPEMVRYNRRNAMARRRSQGKRDSVNALVVLERDDGLCGICGQDVDPLNYHVDHITPLARGGDHSYENVQVAHPRCNQRKSSSLPLAA